MNKNINLDIRLPQDPDEYIIKILTDNMALTPEGKALRAFADDNGVKTRFFWHDTPSQYIIKDNAVYCDRGVGRDRLLGAMAHEFRLASHVLRDPDLAHVLDGRLGRVQLHRQVLLTRAMEGDACSYELAMRAALQERGVIANAAASMVGLTSVQAAKLENSGEGLKDLSLAQLEVYQYARHFIERHGKDPFSAKARREAFLFFQKSLHFKEKIDADMINRFAVKLGKGLPRCQAFAYAAQRPLPDTPAAVVAMSACGLGKDGESYLRKREGAAIAGIIEKNLHPALVKMIKATDRKVARSLALHFGLPKSGYFPKTPKPPKK